MDKISQAAELIRASHHCIAFTGAGISKESGVPTFRGDAESIWAHYDPEDIEISHFYANPAKSWASIRACFYDYMQQKSIVPNHAHNVLARMEKDGILHAIITQNIDALHQAAGSQHVIEFHGTTASCTCTKCHRTLPIEKVDLTQSVPSCPSCGALLKPDFVFFGESIPSAAYEESQEEAQRADICIVVGTTAEVMPAGMIPISVHRHGGKVIEINPSKSAITDSYADIHIPLPAVQAFTELEALLFT